MLSANGDQESSEELVTVAAHELRTPLSVVAGYAELLIGQWEDLPEHSRRQYLWRMSDKVAELLLLVNEILELPRTNETDGAQTFDMADVIEAVLAEMGMIAPERRITVERDGDLPPALGSSLQQMQVLRNLLINAITHSPPDTPVEMSVGRSSGDLLVAVRDRGPGIAEQDRERIFAPFARVQPAQGRPGSGLGLHICRRVVEAHGGRIWVDSIVGEGSTFCYTVPAAAVPEGVASPTP